MNPLAPLMLIAIFLGGGFGSVTRHLFGIWLNGRAALPWGTLLANLFATALLAWVTTRMAARWSDHPALHAAIAVGFCGGFSTFSTFSADTQRLITDGQWGWAAANVALSVAGCIIVFAVISGMLRR